MSVLDRIMPIMNKGNYLYRLDLEDFYETCQYERAVAFAKTYIKIPGVKEVIDRMEFEYKEHVKEINQFRDEISDEENKKYTLWEKANKGKNICKMAFIAAIVFYIISSIFDSVLGMEIIYVIVLMQILSLFIFCGGVLGTAIFKIVEMVFGKIYQLYSQKTLDKVLGFREKYLNQIRKLVTKTDNLYLDSLEPIHREVVLMRREQMQQHGEVMRIQEANREFMEQHSEAMLREQTKMREAQERLFEIEQIREKRYRKSR